MNWLASEQGRNTVGSGLFSKPPRTKLHFWFLLQLFLLTSILAHPSYAKRLALVVGNSDYEHVSALRNPANDAADLADALERMGFDVTRGIDLDYRAMRLTLRDFAVEAANAETVVVYYAGHGIEVGNTNYLIPIDAELRSDRDVDLEAIQLDTVIEILDGSTGLKIVLVDACRNNPFAASMSRTSATRSIGRGLGRIEPSGVFVAYAARGGTLALDGEGRNSPFAEALLEHIEEPGLEVGRMFRKIRSRVLSLTDGYQEPFTYGSLPDQDIFLVPAAAPPPDNVGVEIAVDYAKAQEKDTVSVWFQFLSDYANRQTHPLYTLALRRYEELKKLGNTLPAPREPWLVLPPESARLKREDVARVQQALIYAGFDPGTPDGALGPRTRAAIFAANEEYELEISEEINNELLAELPDPEAVEALIGTKTREFSSAEAQKTGEKRLQRAVDALVGHEYLLDYFEGRLYIAVIGKWSYDWYDTKKLAQATGGHLASITSAAEDRFVQSLFLKDSRLLYIEDDHYHGPYIGLEQSDMWSGPEGGWTWLTGEPVDFLRWGRGLPDDTNSSQNFAGYRSFGTDRRGPFYWDDIRGGLSARSFIIEID